MDYEDKNEAGFIKAPRNNREALKTIKEIGDIFRDNGESFEKESLKGLDKNIPEKPGFPFIIFSIAILKDAIDVLDITIGGVILTTVLSVLCVVIMFIWCWGKIGGGIWKKALIRWILWGIVFVFFVEMVPFIKIMPANSIFILMAYFKEKKIVRLFTLALEKMHKANIINRISRG